ncbi:MAG TPA: hypothetical protein VD995_01250 [Azospirillum sp.]|nr:hypothetical protein [Azospirillum sp.]
MSVQDVKRRQRTAFFVGVLVAAVPVIMQLIAAAVILLSPAEDFPNYDKGLSAASFWLVQIVLLAVAVCGNTFVNYFRVSMVKPVKHWAIVVQTAVMVVILFGLSTVTTISLLNSPHVGLWLTAVAMLGIINLFLSYRVEIDLALTEADLL